jgi:anti-anti-sigma factor
MSRITTSSEDASGTVNAEAAAMARMALTAPASGEDRPSALDRVPATCRVELREISGHTSIVALIGDHDLVSRHRLREELERARLAATVIVDLTRCTFLESSVIGSLVNARNRMHVELALPPAGSTVDRTLSIAGLHELFATHKSLAEALDHSHPRQAQL